MIPQVATVLVATFDTTSIRVWVKLDYLQLKLMDSGEFVAIAFWIIFGIALAIISIILALPAAYQVCSPSVAFLIARMSN